MSESVLAYCGPILIFLLEVRKLNTINKKIEITAELKTVLGDVNKTINDLQTKLK
jgi:hypothetical protein